MQEMRSYPAVPLPAPVRIPAIETLDRLMFGEELTGETSINRASSRRGRHKRGPSRLVALLANGFTMLRRPMRSDRALQQSPNAVGRPGGACRETPEGEPRFTGSRLSAHRP